MEVLMERHGEKANVVGMNVKIPTDRSALSVLTTNNNIVDGAQFNKDSWIYVNGKKWRKWFITVGGTRIWEPILYDIPKLENRYYSVKGKREYFIENKWKPLVEKMLEAGGAHVKPVGNFDGEPSWWLYKVRSDGHTPPQRYVSFDWVNTPEHPKNVDLGRTYYLLEQQLSRYGSYLYKFKRVLERAIEQYLENEHKISRDGVYIKLNINDRLYWYRTVRERYNTIRWVKLAWPEDKIISVDL